MSKNQDDSDRTTVTVTEWSPDSDPVPGFMTAAKRDALSQARAIAGPPRAAPAWQAEREAGSLPREPDSLEGTDALPARDRDLLTRIADDNHLMAAWVEVRDADLEDGSLSPGARAFERDALDRLTAIQSALLDGSWSPQPPTRFELPGSNPVRVLTVSTVADRIVERAIVEVVGPLVDQNLTPFSFAYRRGLGVRDAVSALRESMLAGWTHVVRTDVARAFDETPRGPALAMLQSVVPERNVTALVEKLLQRLDTLGMAGCGIPQGSAISPMLLNLYLDQLDRRILDSGLLPIRYADDMAIPVNGEKSGLEVVEFIADALDDLGLRLSPDKTQVLAFDHSVDFLGQQVRPLGSPDSLDDHAHPRRIVLYAMGPGGIVRARGERVRIDRKGETVAAMHMSRVRQIVLGARMGVTTPLLHEAARAGIDVVMVSEHGGYVGRFSRRRGGDVEIRRAQYRTADDAEASLAIARALVAGKIGNLRVCVLRDLRRRGADTETGNTTDVARQLDRWAGRASDAYSIASLMGIEGTAARVYFEWMADHLDEAWKFSGRNRRPPRDPVNAMLSFGYTLLSTEVVTACEVGGMDPDLGFLHSPRWGRPSLALDLVEEWRPVLVDSVVLRLVRAGHVQPTDFESDHERGCRMNDKARRAFLAAYERRMLTLASSPISQGRRAYRELLAVHARSLAGHLRDPTIPYQGYRWR